MPTKITKEQARENRLDVLEGRAYVAELIEKRIPELTWKKWGYQVFRTKIDNFYLHVYHDESARFYPRNFFSNCALQVVLAEGSYEKIAAKAPYTKAIYRAICALEAQ